MKNSERTSDFSHETKTLASHVAILEELDRIKSDEMFASASRLVDLLDYIVTQHLTAPGRKIFAKTIAEEIYDRTLDQDSDNHNIVRVDAGRLRRRLAEYYAGPGQNDPISIHVDPGAYVPRFEVRNLAPVVRNTEPAETGTSLRNRYGLAVLISSVLVALLFGFVLGNTAPRFGRLDASETVGVAHSSDSKLEAERRARMTKSLSSMQAVTLADHARNLIFPMFEQDQLELSLAMFRQAIRKDKTYFGGYAGASQCLSAMAVLLSDDTARHEFLSESRRMVDRAIELSPTNSWSQSALSWTLFAEGQVAGAREHAEIALELAPTDGNVLDFYAMLMLLVGDFEAAREAADPDRTRTSGLGRYANRSFFGAASFHLGLYQEAIGSLTAATVSGDPISAPTLAYLAASYQGLGKTKRAKQYALELMENWPRFNPSVVFGRIYLNLDHTKSVSDKLRAAGWIESERKAPKRPITK